MKQAAVKIPTIYQTPENREIIQYFCKTPLDIVCPHFWLLNWGHGCRFGCSYCYLRGTFYGNIEPVSYPINEITSNLVSCLRREKTPRLFNSGEKMDSLAFPETIRIISDIFEEQSLHKLLILTKSGNINTLLDKSRKQTVFSFSINTPEVSKLWEQNTPSPDMRIKAAKSAYELGNEVRVRIDPIFPIDNWKEYYSDLIDNILSNLTPTIFTIGTPRGLSKTIRFAKDRTWTKYFTENSSWGKKIPEEQRIEIYSFLIDKLKGHTVSICKDTVDIWKKLGMDYNNVRCNCKL